jgi:hypothetical protein
MALQLGIDVHVLERGGIEPGLIRRGIHLQLVNPIGEFSDVNRQHTGRRNGSENSVSNSQGIAPANRRVHADANDWGRM